MKNLDSADELLGSNDPTEEEKLVINGDGNDRKMVDYDRSSNQSTTANDSSNETQIRDVFKFPFIFWILCISCVAVYGTLL